MARRRTAYLLAATALLAALTPTLDAANHREAPITALDHKADITDVYAFMSYGPGGAGKVTLMMGVDPLLDPANGPNWFPFDDEILYELKVDNNNDAREDITIQFRFETEQRLPSLFQVYAGIGNGAFAPSNSPAPVAPGTLIVPPQITSFDSPGLGQRQRYSVRAFSGNQQFDLFSTDGRPLYAVPTNVGPRTMDYVGALQPGHLQPAVRHQGLRRHHGRCLLDGPRRHVRHGQPAELRRTGRAERGAGRGERELRRRHRLGLRRQHAGHRDPGQPAHADRPRRAGHFACRHHRRVGHHLAPARVRAPQHQRRAGSIWPVPPGAAHGQRVHQRAHHRYGLEGSLQHGPARERHPVRQLLRGSRRSRAC